MMTVRQAYAQCRANHHGSYNYDTALQVLLNAYREAFPLQPGEVRYASDELKAMWPWVESRLKMVG